MKRLLALALFSTFVSLNAPAQKPGEIVFSKNLIDPSKPAALTTQFHTGDNIYAMAC